VAGVTRRIAVQAGLGKKQDAISKITRGKRIGGTAQGIEHLPIKSEAQYHKKKN
jgi:hypothetical protein